jgi:hypothetical protein
MMWKRDGGGGYRGGHHIHIRIVLAVSRGEPWVGHYHSEGIIRMLILFIRVQHANYPIRFIHTNGQDSIFPNIDAFPDHGHRIRMRIAKTSS